jgi:hypothetical protein
VELPDADSVTVSLVVALVDSDADGEADADAVSDVLYVELRDMVKVSDPDVE